MSGKYFEETMLIEQPGESPDRLLERYEQQARAWRHRQAVEANRAAAQVSGDIAHMLEQLTGALSAALLSQPTPTAIACERCGGTGYQGDSPFTAGAPCPDCAPTTPTRIEDMAPGTTFRARTLGGVLSAADRLWFVSDTGTVFSTEAHHIDDHRIDPSTIHDVTPPKDHP